MHVRPARRPQARYSQIDGGLRMRNLMGAILAGAIITLGSPPGWAQGSGNESPRLLKPRVLKPRVVEAKMPKPEEPPLHKRVIHAIEIDTKSKKSFSGRITLRFAHPKARGHRLQYHWGGRCKKTKMTMPRVALLMEAMRLQMGVEITAKPMRHSNRIVMCMSRFRIVNE